MIVIDIYGKIEKTKISDKLNLFISNLPSDWRDGLVNDMLKEVRQQKVDIKENIREFGNSYQTEYTISYFKKIIEQRIENYSEKNLGTIEECIECIADNMVCLFFAHDFNHEEFSFFGWEENRFEGRSCEDDYAEKIVNFINFVHRELPQAITIDCVYSSNLEVFEKTRILSIVDYTIFSKRNSFGKNESIDKLIAFGNQLDNFLRSENDYYKLNYIMDTLYKGDSYNQFHYFKVFSVLEILLLGTNQPTRELDPLLVPYLEERYKNQAISVAENLRQMRNKIGHGDFKGFNAKAESFAQNFMIDFWFDYFEYSRLNWILVHTCCLLDDLLRMVLLQKLKENFQGTE